MCLLLRRGLPRWCNGEESVCPCRRCRRREFDPWVGKFPWRRTWLPTPVFLPRASHGQRSLAGCSPQGRREPDATEHTAGTLLKRLPLKKIVSSTKALSNHSICITLPFLENETESHTMTKNWLKVICPSAKSRFPWLQVGGGNHPWNGKIFCFEGRHN